VPAASTTGALIGKRLGRYEVLALIALGGTAEIYLARIGGAAGFEKFVVIKCLHEHLADDAEFVSMFLDEARLAAQLDHSNIVQTFELGQHEGRYFMAMEYLGGMSLAMMVRRAADRVPGGVLPVALALNIVQQACMGLHYAHERQNAGVPLQVVHRDVSPQNLVITFEGVVKVVDFGIARAEQRETRTRAGTIKGKFAYMSPEQCVSQSVDRRTDIFALGVILYELVTGKRLFKRSGQYETYQAVMECAVPPPSSQLPALDPGVDALVMKAVAKDKQRRYPTAEAFGDAILRYLHQRNIYAGPGALAQFIDTTYGPELAEHGARMREFIAGTGRERQGTDDAEWDEEISGEVVEPSIIGDLADFPDFDGSVASAPDDESLDTLDGVAPVRAAAVAEAAWAREEHSELSSPEIAEMAGEIITGADGPVRARKVSVPDAVTADDGGMGLSLPPVPSTRAATSAERGRRPSKFGDGPGLGTALSELELGSGARPASGPAQVPTVVAPLEVATVIAPIAEPVAVMRPAGPGVTMAARPAARASQGPMAPPPTPAQPPPAAPWPPGPPGQQASPMGLPAVRAGAVVSSPNLPPVAEPVAIAPPPPRPTPLWLLLASFAIAVGLAMALTIVIARALQ
jgi:tRNA A-37 threonylcarbamoyl transferase component Bud32